MFTFPIGNTFASWYVAKAHLLQTCYYQMNRQELGQLLRRTREEQSVTQTQLAKDLGTDQGNISKTEKDGRYPQTAIDGLKELGVEVTRREVFEVKA